MHDPRTDRLIAVFRGTVRCRREPGPPPGLTLAGAPADGPEETLILTFSGSAPQDLPETLPAPSVVALEGDCYRIQSPPGEWLVWARGVRIHRDLSTAFYRAIAPRPVPLRKRLFWYLVLALARSGLGRLVLAMLRRR